MTTIALRGRILAADTQLAFADMRLFCRKIFPIGNKGCIAFAGNSDAEFLFRRWFMAGEKLENHDKAMSKCDAIYIDQWKDRWWYPDGGPEKIPIEHEFHAIGSGSKLAMAGMQLGLTAKEAVEFASEMDVNTNSLVDTYDIQTQKLTLCKWSKINGKYNVVHE